MYDLGPQVNLYLNLVPQYILLLHQVLPYVSHCLKKLKISISKQNGGLR